MTSEPLFISYRHGAGGGRALGRRVGHNSLMGRIFRTVAVGSLLAMLLMGAGTFIFRDRLLVWLKPTIEGELSRVAGEELQYARAELSLWPPIGVTVEGVTLGTKSAGRVRGTIERITTRLNLTRMIGGEVVVDALEVVKPDLTLLSNPSRSSRDSMERGQGGSSAALPITLERIELVEGRVFLDDADILLQSVNYSGALQVADGRLHLSRGSLSGRVPFIGDLHARFSSVSYGDNQLQLEGIDAGLMGGTLRASGVIAPDLRSGSIQVKATDIDGTTLLSALQSALPVDLSVSSLGTLFAEGSLEFARGAPRFNGSLRFPQIQGTFRKLPLVATNISLTGSSAGTVNLTEAGVTVGELSRATISGRYNLQAKEGEFSVALPTSPADRLGPVLRVFAPNIPVSLSGRVQLQGRSTIKLDSAVEWSGSLSLTEVGVVHPKLTTSNMSGELSLKGRGAAGVLETKGLEGRFEPGGVPFRMQGSLASHGSAALTLSLPTTDLARLQGLLTKMGVSSVMVEPLGTLSATVDLQGVQRLSGKLSVTGVALPVAGYALREITGTIPITFDERGGLRTDPVLTAQFAGLPVQIRGSLTQKGARSTLDQGELQGFEGRVSIQGVIEGGDRIETLRLQGEGHSLTVLSKAFLGPKAPDLTGTVARLQIALRGPLGAFPFTELEGTGAVSIVDAVLKGVNLPRTVIDSLEGVPFLAGKIRNNFPPEYEGELQKADTEFPELRGSFRLRAGRLETNDLVARGAFYAITGQGSIGLDGVLSLSTQLVFDKKFSDALVREARDSARILNARGQIEVPVQLRGPVRDLSIRPDLSRLIQNAGERLLQREAEKLLEGILNRQGDRKRRQQPSTGSSPAAGG